MVYKHSNGLGDKIVRKTLIAFLLITASVPGFAYRMVAYEANDEIVLQLSNSEIVKMCGHAPEFSPDGKMLAYFSNGNVFVYDLASRKHTQLTRHPVAKTGIYYFRQRARWNPSGTFIAYTRLHAYRFLRKRKVYVPIKRELDNDWNTCTLSTIWLVDVKTGKTWEAVGLSGDFKFFARSNQIEAASVYEPFFSPDGKYLGFGNAGSIYQIPFVDHPSNHGKVRLIAPTGDLDSCPNLSKSGMGVREICWDAKHSRIVYWVGRFWGMWYNWYGYLPWRNGKWGKAVEWHPDFTPADPSGNNRMCAVDPQGRLWTWAEVKDGLQWMRYDGREKLPAGAQNPTFR